MDPFLGPASGALVGALCAASALGVVRLGRLSSRWWRGLRERARGAQERQPEAGPATPESGPSASAAPLSPAATPAAPVSPAATPAAREASFPEPAAAFRHAALALGSATLVGALGLVAALGLMPGAREGALGASARSALGAGRLVEALLEGGFAVALTLAAALVAASLERGLLALLARLGRAPQRAPVALGELLSGLRVLLPGDRPRGETAGVGLAYSFVFLSATLPWSAFLALGRGRMLPGGLVLFGLAVLLVPLAYGAAAERSESADLAHARHAAAARQLAAAPAWGTVLVAVVAAAGSADLAGVAGRGAGLGHAAGALALVLASLAALPGTSTAALDAAWPWGGDDSAPSRAVRTLTGLAHYAWLAAWATLVALLLVGGSLARWPAASAAVLVALLGVRSLAAARGGAWIARLGYVALPLAGLELGITLALGGRRG